MTREQDILRKRDRFCGFISQIYGVPASDILGRTRRTPLPDCRMMLALALSKEGYTRIEVGRALGMDHSSITRCVQVADSRIGFAGWKEFSRKWSALCDEIERDNDAAAHFRSSLAKDSAESSEIILNTLIIQSLKNNGKQDSSKD